MIKNPLLFILDSDNNYLRYTGIIKALSGYREEVVVITPQPITDFLSVSMMPNNANYNRYEQYVRPRAEKGSDYVSVDDPLYQQVANWNVFRIEILQKALAEFSKFRSGDVSFSFAFQQISASSKAVTYKGSFGVDSPLPTTLQEVGDYYECEDYAFTLVSGTFTYEFSKGMLVYWNGERWVKDRLKTLGSASAVNLPVEPSHAVGYELEDEEINTVEPVIADLVQAQLDIIELDNVKMETDLSNQDVDSSYTPVYDTDIVVKKYLDDNEAVINAELVRLEQDKADITYVDSQDGVQDGRLDDLETFKNTTVPTTYETKSDATTHKGRTTALENANMVKTITRTGSNLFTITYYNNTSTTLLTLAELKAFMGEATQSVSGLMSATDKTHLDGLVALLNGDDEDDVVNTIAEVLAIFENYPEGADILSALADKVDKVEGKGLSTNDLTDILKGNYNTAYEHSQVLDGNPHETKYDDLYDLPTSIHDTQITDVYDKQYVDALKDMNGWESELITLTPLGDTDTVTVATLSEFNTLRLQVRNTATGYVDTDSFKTSIGLVNGYKLKLYDEDVYLEIGATNATFNAPTADWELMIVGVKYTDLVADDVEYDNTDSGLTAETVQDAVDELDDRLDTVESKLNVVGLDYKEYGIREVVGQSASEFERVTRFGGEVKLGSATGLVANVAIDDEVVSNSFDFIPIFKREKVSIDATDLSSNTVSNTFVKVPKYYIKEEWTTEGGIDYHYYWVSQFKHDGYRLPISFISNDGVTENDYYYMGAYEAFLDANNKLRSLTGQFPRITYSRNNFRTAARALDGLGVNSKYQITDLAEYVDLVQIPFMIEFATKHSQGVFLGATSMPYSASHTAVADGTAVNFIVVSNATGANFVLGQTISIGTEHTNSTVANDRVVTLIEVDTPNAGETKITFDGAAVNIAIGNVIASRGWKTGATDQVKVSGTHALNDGKHSIVWRGLENPFGNIWKNVDGVKISNQKAYVTENPKDYNDTASVAGVYAEPYLPLGYTNALTNNYAQDLGYDANYPYAKFPITVQASSALYFRGYYYQNTGDRTVFVGGLWYDSSVAGLFSWRLSNDLGFTSFGVGARLSYRP